MKLIRLRYIDETSKCRPIWLNADNICSIRQNHANPNKCVIVTFEVDYKSAARLREWHVIESVDEILQQLDPAHALRERILGELET